MPVPGFRELFHLLIHDDGTCPAYEGILLPYQTPALETMSLLRRFAQLDAMAWNRDDDACSGGNRQYYTCMEHLYALSRVNDLLILPFQPRWNPDATAWQPDIRSQERSAWLRSLGMHEITHTDFHPFYHEIVEVVQAPDPDEPATLLETLWPGFLLGQMLFCRAGARIRAGSHVVCKDIAEHSRMYWAYTRSNRRPVDLSHGWGSNSQWATDFRRDYVTGGAYVYNVDGWIDLNEDSRLFNVYSSGEIDEADAPYNTRPVLIELLTHRCFTLTPERTDDEFPYNLTYFEPRPDAA